MKIIKYYILIILTGIIFYSCDDAGQDPQWIPKGQISFSFNNLKSLLPAVDGYYHLWLALDSSGHRTWYELGRFNISAAGEMVDTLGNTLVFSFAGDTSSLGYASKSTLTVGRDAVPDKTVLIAADLTVTDDSVSGALWVGHNLAFGEVGKRILGSGYPMAYGRYQLISPTTNNTQCTKGIWFCDTLGNAGFSDGLNLTPGRGWIFEGWLNDKSSGSYYSIGRFYNPYNADGDGAGLCKGLNGNGYNKPGQDFIQTGGPQSCPAINNIMNGNFAVYVSVELENESGPSLDTPFFLKPFGQGNIVSSLGCSRFDNLFNQSVLGIMPNGRIKITN